MEPRAKCPIYGCRTIFETLNYMPHDRPNTLHWLISDHLWVQHDLTQAQSAHWAAQAIKDPDLLVSVLMGNEGLRVVNLRGGLE